MTPLWRSAAIATTLLALLHPTPGRPFPRYKMTPIAPVSPLVWSVAEGMAPNAGFVAGFGGDASYTPQGLLWRAPGPMQLIPPLGSDQASRVTAVNDRGQAVGWSGYADSSTGTAFVHDGTTSSALPALSGYGYGRATAINNAGTIVGLSHVEHPAPLDMATIWYGGVANRIGTGTTESGRNPTTAWDLNQSGGVIGDSDDPHDAAATHAFFWDGDPSGDAVDLPEPPGAVITNALAINDEGQAVGSSMTLASGQLALFWDKDHTFSEIPPPPEGDVPIARDINNGGWVVGTSGAGAWVWHAAEGTAALQDLLLEGDAANWDLRSSSAGALGIDNRGRIAGAGLYQGNLTAFLATPVPAPRLVNPQQQCIRDLPLEDAGKPVGWVVGGDPSGRGVDGYGVILRTTDGGAAWTRQGTAAKIPDVFLQTVSAVDACNAWIVGQPADGYGVILRTEDGGRTWDRQGDAGQIPDEPIFSVSAVNKRIAWAAGEHGLILHTKDGGETWIRQGEETLPETLHLEGVYASDASHVWVAGSDETCHQTTGCGVVYHSANGGRSWEQQPFPATPTAQNGGYLITIQGSNSRNLWAVGNSTVIHSDNGGRTWENLSKEAGDSPWDVNGVYTVNRRSVWTAADFDALYKYDGAGWTQQISSQTSPLPGYYLLRVSAVDPQEVWVIGSYNPVGPSGNHPMGLILHSGNGGDDWVRQDPGLDNANFWSVSFVATAPTPEELAATALGPARWSAVAPISQNPVEAAEAAIAIAPDGTRHAVWRDYLEPDDPASPSNVFYATSPDGMDWSGPVNISRSPQSGNGPQIALGDGVHLVWSSESGDDPERHDILYSHSPDGLAWSDPLRLSDPVYDAYDPVIAVGPDGRVHTAYMQGRFGAIGGEFDVVYRGHDGSGWSAPVQVTHYVYGGAYYPQLAVDPAGGLHLVWRGEDGPPRTYYSTSADGSVWSEPEDVTPRAIEPFGARVAVDDRIHLIWFELVPDLFGPGTEQFDVIYRSSLGDGGWGERQNLSYNSGTSALPDIGLDPLGGIHVVWEDDTIGQAYGSFDILYTASADDGSWSAPVNISHSVGTAALARLAVDDAGYAHGVWTDETFRPLQVVYATDQPLAVQDRWVLAGLGGKGQRSLARLATESPTLLAGTLFDWYRRGGVYRSTDGGLEWSASGLQGFGMNIFALETDPGDPNTVYAGVFDAGWDQDGVYKSTDAGQSWQHRSEGLGVRDITDLAIDPAHPQTLYAATWGGGVYKSTDGAATWKAANNGLPEPLLFTLAIDPGDTRTLYAGGYVSHGGGALLGSLYKSTDGGASWLPSWEGIPPLDIDALAVDPLTPTTLYAATWGGGVYKSSDGGAHWVQKAEGLTELRADGIQVDACNPRTLYVSTPYAGVFRSSDGGEHWSAYNSGLTEMEVNTLLLTDRGRRLWAGTFATGLYMLDRSDSWQDEVIRDLTCPGDP